MSVVAGQFCPRCGIHHVRRVRTLVALGSVDPTPSPGLFVEALRPVWIYNYFCQRCGWLEEEDRP